MPLPDWGLTQMHRLRAVKKAIHTVTSIMEETQCGKALRTKGHCPSTAATAFRLLAAIRSGTISSTERLRQRLPPDWAALAPQRSSLAQCTQQLQDKAIELTKAEVLQDMRDLQKAEKGDEGEAIDEQQRKTRRNAIGRRIAQLSRKTVASGIYLMLDAQGQVHSEDAQVAELLAAHWRKVFAHKPIDEEKLEAWCRTAAAAGTGTVTAPAAAWRLRTRDVKRALRIAGNSRPGPDGIPFQAWRSLGKLGEHILWEAGRQLAVGLQAGDADHDSFNESLLCCLPKDTQRADEVGTPIHTPATTRPLSITNCDNRIIANAYRLVWEPIIGPVVTTRQRGFIQGRSMLANVVEVEHAAALAAMECEGAVIVLFDFTAAFPSISRKFMMRMAQAAGFPEEAMKVLTSLYHLTVGKLLFRGRLHDDVEMEAGIRQGCPLSPLLFALASDSLLRLLERRTPTATSRAFADDTAMVLRSWAADQKRVFRIFAVFEAVSNLALNLAKTVVIPLWDADVDALQEATRALPNQPQVTWAATGRYLGYYVGPGKGTLTWKKPLEKYTARLAEWNWSELGLCQAVATYNTYVLPILLYVAQLEAPPAEVLAAEAVAIRRIAPGPGAWCSAADLHHGSDLGLAASVRPMRISCLAAMLRMHTWEAHLTGDLPWARLETELRRARTDTVHLVRAVRFRTWLDSHAPTVVRQVVREAGAQGVSAVAARKALTQVEVGPLTVPQAHHFKARTQRWYMDQLRSRDGYHVEVRLRHRLERWRLVGFPARHARCAASHLLRAKKLLPPRVRAAMLSTILNRWTTDRRMRAVRHTRGACVLGCSPTADDSVEHYVRCPVGRQWSQQAFAGELDGHDLAHHVLAAPMTDYRLSLQGVTTYVLYRTVHHVRRRGFVTEAQRAEFVRHYMSQQLHEATRSSAKLRRTCDVWAALALKRRREQEADPGRAVRPRPGNS